MITYKEMDTVFNDYLEGCKAKAKAQGKDSGLAYAAALGGMQAFLFDMMLSSNEKVSRQVLQSMVRATDKLKGEV